MSLKDFLGKMENEKQVLHIKDSVSTKLEISNVMKNFDSNGPILMFDNVKGYECKIAANVCGTRQRLSASLNVKQDKLCEKLSESWRSPKKCKIVADGVVKEKTDKNVDLSKYPILTHFEKDAAPYLTSAVVHTKSVDDKIENVSIHRLQVLDKNHLAIRLVPRHLFKLWNLARESGRDLDVAISVGVHPAVMLAASSPVAFGVCEFDVANALLNSGLQLVECRSVNACAPAEAELVLEGRISVSKEVVEGPFVDITGTYDVQRKQPVVEVVGVMHRKDLVYEALLPSGSEHKLLMGLPHEVLIWDSVAKVVPKVCAVNLSVGGCGWLHAVIAVEKQVNGDGKNVLLAAFAAHPSLKHAVVVDSDIDVFDPCDVEWAIATRFQASKDLLIINNVRGSTLDSSADQETGLTSKVGVDATRPFAKPRGKFERAKIPASKNVEAVLRKLRGM
jgi:UbiD family decarboxylase